jgi:hypothetical protein
MRRRQRSSSRRDDPFARAIVGFTVVGVDGEAGKIDAATVRAAAGDLVVDTGGWRAGRRRLIPSGVLDGIDGRNRSLHVAMTREQIERSPRVDPRAAAALDDAEYFDHFGRFLGGF